MINAKKVTGNELADRANPDTLDPSTRMGLSKRCYFEIAPEDRLYLTEEGHGDDARFAGIFRDAWFKIPEKDRNQMTDYWRPHEWIPGVQAVRIFLENSDAMRSPPRIAYCEGSGLRLALYFYSPVVDLMPPKHVAALIAHELAHVFQASNGTLDATPRPEFMTDEYISGLAGDCRKPVEEIERKLRHMCDPAEHEADRIAKRWGFNTPAMCRWVSRHIKWDELPEPVC